MKESRLFGLLYTILERKRVTAKELAEKFEVSIRTIYRDLDALSASGIPVYTQKGRTGGIAIAEEFVLSKSLLTVDERESRYCHPSMVYLLPERGMKINF